MTQADLQLRLEHEFRQEMLLATEAICHTVPCTADVDVAMRLGAPVWICRCGHVGHQDDKFWKVSYQDNQLVYRSLPLIRSISEAALADAFSATVRQRHCSSDCAHRAALAFKLYLLKYHSYRHVRSILRTTGIHVLFGPPS